MPFSHMPLLLAIADQVTKLQAICTNCGDEAHFTQRLVDGKAANYDDQLLCLVHKKHIKPDAGNVIALIKNQHFIRISSKSIIMELEHLFKFHVYHKVIHKFYH